MTRKTSVQAFEELVNTGELGRKQRLALAALNVHGSLTGNEVARHTSSPGIWKRLSELKKLGLVKETGERKCSVTGKKCVTWGPIYGRVTTTSARGKRK